MRVPERIRWLVGVPALLWMVASSSPGVTVAQAGEPVAGEPAVECQANAVVRTDAELETFLAEIRSEQRALRAADRPEIVVLNGRGHNYPTGSGWTGPPVVESETR